MSGYKINGKTMLGFVKALGINWKRMAEKYFIKSGLPNPNDMKPDEWYPRDYFLEAVREIGIKVGPKTLFKIGSTVVKEAHWPPGIDSIEAALGNLDVAYHINHKNPEGKIMFNPETNEILEGIGHYKFEHNPGEKSGKVIMTNPFPCEYGKGILKGTGERFNTPLEIEHDHTKPCRDKGGESCTYYVFWK